MKRRDFLISGATLAGAGLPVLGWAAGKPCPPPSLSVSGGGSTATTCQASSGLPALILSSAAPSGTYGWTFGQAFRKGDVPSGSTISSDGGAVQAEVRNRWSDGSVKFAVLSGVSAFTQNVPKVFGLTVSSTPVAAASVPEPTSLDVTVAFSGSVNGTYSLQAALGVDKEAWGGKSAAGRVRKIPGPIMSEFHYYVPTSDPHVAIWFFVRRYSNGATEVETVVENGWLNVASPGQKDYTVTVRVGGSGVYGPTSLSHLHHTRWSRVDWIGTDPRLTPRHDGPYLKATLLVPNYGDFGSPSEAALDSLVQASEPFAQAAWPDTMGTAGSGGSILNNWDALYVTSGDARAYRSVIANARAAGRYGLHYRDETTGRMPEFAVYASYGYGANSGISGNGSATRFFPDNGGRAPPVYAKSHAPPFGILAYLLTGRRAFAELVELQAQPAFFSSSISSSFEGMRVPNAAAGAWTTRGAAWAIRSIAAAVVCVPDGDGNAAQYRTHLGKTLGYYGSNFTGKNALGMVPPYSTYTAGVTDTTNFMEDSFSMACAWAYQAASDALGSDKARAEAFVLWRQKHIVGRFGTKTGYCYRDAANYLFRSASTDVVGASTDGFNAAMYPDFAKAYANTIGANNCDESTALNGSSGSSPAILSTATYPYWGLAHTALAFAVDLGVPGAAEAWARLVSASNYAPQNFGNLPMWSVVPR